MHVQNQQLMYLTEQLAKQPHNLGLLDQLAALYLQLKQPEQASDIYLRYIAEHKTHAGAQFNCAYYARLAGRYEQAIDYYRRALALGIDGAEEVYANIGVIYNEGLLDNDHAQEAFKQALTIYPNYVPALYNLANSYEQDGDKANAAHYFNRVIEQEPNFVMAYVRLADVYTADTADDALILKLMAFFKAAACSLDEQIDIAYALGKLFDDCGSYDQAWHYYCEANNLNARTVPAWSRNEQLRLLNEIKQTFSAESFTAAESGNLQPVFICGMYRSGSTLLEQMLGAHDAITNGGELEYFPRLWQSVEREGLSAYCSKMSEEDFKTLGEDYTRFVETRFENGGIVTDKRPDNIWRLGLIKRAVPNAKFIVTQRQLLDNCLSVYFTRLNASMNYANSIQDILDFLELEQQLLAHWQSIFGDDLIVVDYDKLVRDPEATLRPVFEWLGLPWQSDCLTFHQRHNSVRTASVWQVRQPLYQRSSGRFKNYERFLSSR